MATGGAHQGKHPAAMRAIPRGPAPPQLPAQQLWRLCKCRAEKQGFLAQPAAVHSNMARHHKNSEIYNGKLDQLPLVLLCMPDAPCTWPPNPEPRGGSSQTRMLPRELPVHSSPWGVTHMAVTDPTRYASHWYSFLLGDSTTPGLPLMSYPADALQPRSRKQAQCS